MTVEEIERAKNILNSMPASNARPATRCEQDGDIVKFFDADGNLVGLMTREIASAIRNDPEL